MIDVEWLRDLHTELYLSNSKEMRADVDEQRKHVVPNLHIAA